MSTLANILDRIATDEAALTGSPKVYNHDQAPNTINVTPCFINVPGGATYEYEAFAAGVIFQQRDIRLLFFLEPLEMPGDVGRFMNALEPWHQRVVAKFKSDYNLNKLVEGAWLVSDTGMSAAMEWGGTLYAGFEFVLRVGQFL
jgi:hypothetical protein